MATAAPAILSGAMLAQAAPIHPAPALLARNTASSEAGEVKVDRRGELDAVLGFEKMANRFKGYMMFPKMPDDVSTGAEDALNPTGVSHAEASDGETGPPWKGLFISSLEKHDWLRPSTKTLLPVYKKTHSNVENQADKAKFHPDTIAASMKAARKLASPKYEYRKMFELNRDSNHELDHLENDLDLLKDQLAKAKHDLMILKTALVPSIQDIRALNKQIAPMQKIVDQKQKEFDALHANFLSSEKAWLTADREYTQDDLKLHKTVLKAKELKAEEQQAGHTRSKSASF